MTDLEQKALALLNEVRTERGFAPVGGLYGSVLLGQALCRAIEQIEQHEAFRKEVSDALLEYYGGYHNASGEPLERFIIPAPKPDPLVAVFHEVDTGPEWDSPEDYCNKIRAALEARGLEIREKNDD